MNDLIYGVLLGGPGAALLLTLLARILPNDSLKALFRGAGKMVSAKGRSKLGKAFYEPIEKFMEDSLKIACEGFIDGLSADDKNENGNEKKR